jgi:hypothetical protein
MQPVARLSTIVFTQLVRVFLIPKNEMTLPLFLPSFLLSFPSPIGKTDAAKADMKRLAEVRRRREEAEKKCVAEGRKPGWTENGVEESDGSDSDEEEEKTAKPKAATAVPSAAEAKKKAAAMETVDTSGEIPKLSSIEIKKMNADAVKEHLKTRGLSTQGQKKDLMKRLVDYEAARE